MRRRGCQALAQGLGGHEGVLGGGRAALAEPGVHAARGGQQRQRKPAARVRLRQQRVALQFNVALQALRRIIRAGQRSSDDEAGAKSGGARACMLLLRVASSRGSQPPGRASARSSWFCWFTFCLNCVHTRTLSETGTTVACIVKSLQWPRTTQQVPDLSRWAGNANLHASRRDEEPHGTYSPRNSRQLESLVVD